MTRLPRDDNRAPMQAASYINLTASGQVKASAGILWGFVVNSHTSGTLKVWDSLSAAGNVIFNTITFASGPNFVVFSTGVVAATGIYATIGGTADITFLYS